MLDDDKTTSDSSESGAAEGAPQDAPPPVVKETVRRAPAKRTAKKAAAAPPPEAPQDEATTPPDDQASAPTVEKTVRKTTRKAPAKRTTKKAAAAAEPAAEADVAPAEVDVSAEAVDAPVEKPIPRKRTTKRTTKKVAAPVEDAAAVTEAPDAETPDVAEDATQGAGPAVLFQTPVATTTRRTRKSTAKKITATEAGAEAETPAASEEAPAEEPKAPAKRARARKATAKADAQQADAEQADAEQADAEQADAERADAEQAEVDQADADEVDTDQEGTDEDDSDQEGDATPARRRRRRGGRRRRKSSDSADNGNGEQADGGEDSADEAADSTNGDSSSEDKADKDSGETSGEGSSRRRRRRRRAGEDNGSDSDDPNTVTKVRQGRSAEDQITAVSGSTRLEAKKQRRREGREAGRRRAPIVSEAEFLARREAVERVMVVRQRADLTQIAVLEDKVLVEHYVARESQTSLIGNVYLGRVQNVLPSMEAAFIDIGKGRNAVLYAGEVNWSALGHKEGQPRKIESVLQSGQTVLVQVTKDPVGQKGARLTSQISLAGRFLVYVPDGTTSGISRKLPDTERNRLKTLLKEIVPDSAGVIVRTAAEGASEEELTRDVERLKARWEDIEKKASGKGGGAQLLYGEPDLTLKVVRDLFTEDFTKLVIEGADAWDTVHGYVSHVAPDLAGRLERFEPATEGRTAGKDVFAAHRIEEQIQKGLDRKVWLPSGGSLIIDRTEAMTVVDVNTGKFTGSGGNLEETVTKNNLEAAEEIVRQLRLRDIGGIIVVDFIDMVLESNRELVVRRLVECLGRDRTRRQVAEVTSLGLVQMTRKRIGTGLLEAFSETCEHCQGRGVVVKDAPVEPPKADDDGGKRGRRGRGRRGGSDGPQANDSAAQAPAPSPADVAAMARPEKAAEETTEEATAVEETPAAQDLVPEQEPVVEKAPESAPEAEDAPAVDEEPPAEEPAESKPAVVSRTRRRSATRPAGPPPAVEAPAAEVVVVRAPEATEVPAPVVTHVPIKKRGTRKR